jgi:heptosyltransferase-2
MHILRYDDSRPPVELTAPRYNLPQETSIKRILIIKWSAMGDIALSTAAIQDIRNAFPDASIDLNTLPAFEKMFAEDPRFNEVFSVDLRKSERNWRGMRRWLQRVRAGRYDLLIDLQSADRTRLMVALLQLTGHGIRYRMGNNPGWPYNITPPVLPFETHGFERLRAALAAGGIPTLTDHPALHVPQANVQHAAQLATTHGLRTGNYAVLLPGCQAAGYLKRWGAERYAALGAKLHAAGLEKVVILGGPDEAEDCATIARLCGNYAINLCGKTQVQDLLPICETARCIIGNDTGTAHLVAATGTPMLVIFGPTDPRRAKPVGKHVIALQVDITDMPCLNCYCQVDCAHQNCMKAITPERAFAEIAAMAGLAARP